LLTSTTSNVSIGTDYETKTTNEQEQINANEQEEIVHPPVDIVHPPVENVQEDDVLVEENVTPFYMNSGNYLNDIICYNIFFNLR
jgi:hypothetical protein